ncbi:MAG: hypothetical protein RL273_1143 [Bacteroidota bacterium]
MKNIIIALLFMIGLNSFAQNTDREFMVLHESKVKDMELFRKNMSAFNPHMKEKFKGILADRTQQRSETGFIYSLNFINGAENLGKYFTMRHDGSNDFGLANPKVDQEMSANWDGPARRSTWILVSGNFPDDYNMENYKFRKILIETIPTDKQEEYEKRWVESRELLSKLGLNVLSVTWKAVEGYTSNTYLTIFPNTSIVDHYIDRAERIKNKEFAEFLKNNLKTNVIKIDHLYTEF